MGLNDYLKCPGFDRTLSTIPKDLQCPQCGTNVEIWSDEVTRRCHECQTMIFNPDPLVPMPGSDAENKSQDTISDSIDQARLDELVQLAISLGCDGAVIVPAEEIVVDPELAALCFEPRCQNYGSSPTCPPYVEGPEWISNYLREMSHALFLKIETEDEILYSDQRREVGKLLHFLVIQVEKAARDMGLERSRGFAGGSCKNLFCFDHYECERLKGSGECRNPDSARPSTSGYGISVRHLIDKVGWETENKKERPDKGNARYGIVILG